MCFWEREKEKSCKPMSFINGSTCKMRLRSFLRKSPLPPKESPRGRGLQGWALLPGQLTPPLPGSPF